MNESGSGSVVQLGRSELVLAEKNFIVTDILWCGVVVRERLTEPRVTIK